MDNELDARIAQHIQEGARWYVCEFVQNTMSGFSNELIVQTVQPQAYHVYEHAQAAAKSLEKGLYRRGLYDCQIEARLARSAAEAKQSRFLDE